MKAVHLNSVPNVVHTLWMLDSSLSLCRFLMCCNARTAVGRGSRRRHESTIFERCLTVARDILRDSAMIMKYLVDTSVFNWLADGWIQSENLPPDGCFAITHIQIDEINRVRDEDRRAR